MHKKLILFICKKLINSITHNSISNNAKSFNWKSYDH